MADPAVDISSMPPPPADGSPLLSTTDASSAVDISDMPSPESMFTQQVGRAPEPAELAHWKTNPEDFAGGQQFAPSVGAQTMGAVKGTVGLGEAALSQGTGATTGLVGGFLAHVGTLLATQDPAGAKAVRDAVTNTLTYSPRTEAGQAINQVPGTLIKSALDAVHEPESLAAVEKAARAVYGDKYVDAIMPGYEMAGEAAQAIPGAAGVASAVGRTAGVVSRGASRFAESFHDPEAVAPAPVPTPAKAVPGPTTGADLRAGTDPLAPQTPAAPMTPAPGAEGAAPGAAPAPAAAPAPTSAPRFASPSPAGTQRAALSPEAQVGRTAELQHLNTDAGGTLGEVRKSAISGDFNETGNDFQHAKSPDAGGQRMQGVIANESDAVKTASKNAVDAAGGTATGTSAPALAERGGIINNSLQSIGDWFDKHISDSYAASDAQAGAQPHVSTNLATQLTNRLPEGTPEGIALQGAATKAAQKLGLIGPDGSALAATGQQAERFRQWTGRQYKPGSASNGMIKDLKDAVDDDAAARAGPGSYAASRALRAQRDQMLDGPKGISNVMNSDRYGNRSVPVEGIPDNIANLPSDQFNHVVNVLKSSAHLGNGELAEGSAAALNEIKGHMAARMHEAGASARSGTWDPYGFHKVADKYSNKMPAVFSQDEINRWHTVNRGGNILRMDARYPGASAQAQVHAGMGMREKIGNTVVGAAEDMIPFGATAGELTGASQGARDLLAGNSGKRHLKEVEGRIQKLPEGPPGTNSATSPQVASLGMKMGGKQGGWIGNKPEASDFDKAHGVTMEGDTFTHKSAQRDVTHHVNEDGDHVFQSGPSSITGHDTPDGGIQINGSATPGAKSEGYGSAVYRAAADHALGNGGTFASDNVVSGDARRRWNALEKQGYTRETNPTNKETANGGVISDNGQPAFTITGKGEPQRTTPLGQRLGGGNQRGGPKFTGKMDPEDFKHLRDNVNVPADSTRRERWDALWMAQDSGKLKRPGDLANEDFTNSLHKKGLNDDHIDTALKAVGKSAIPEGGARPAPYNHVPIVSNTGDNRPIGQRTRDVSPLGQIIGGGNQRGGPKFTPKAAKRLESVRQERNAVGTEEAPF